MGKGGSFTEPARLLPDFAALRGGGGEQGDSIPSREPKARGPALTDVFGLSQVSEMLGRKSMICNMMEAPTGLPYRLA